MLQKKIANSCHACMQAVTQTDCDLIFTKVKTKGAKKINYSEFCAAVEQVAIKKKVCACVLYFL